MRILGCLEIGHWCHFKCWDVETSESSIADVLAPSKHEPINPCICSSLPLELRREQALEPLAAELRSEMLAARCCTNQSRILLRGPTYRNGKHDAVD